MTIPISRAASSAALKRDQAVDEQGEAAGGQTGAPEVDVVRSVRIP